MALPDKVSIGLQPIIYCYCGHTMMQLLFVRRLQTLMESESWLIRLL
jgi:hypothetical protein